MAKQAMLYDSPQHGFKSFSWKFQIKNLYLPQSQLVYELKFPVKKIYIYIYIYNLLQLQNFVYTLPQATTQRKFCLLMLQKS